MIFFKCFTSDTHYKLFEFVFILWRWVINTHYLPFVGEFLHFFGLEDMISTHTKDYDDPKNDPKSLDFGGKKKTKTKPQKKKWPDLYNWFQQIAKI